MSRATSSKRPSRLQRMHRKYQWLINFAIQRAASPHFRDSEIEYSPHTLVLWDRYFDTILSLKNAIKKDYEAHTRAIKAGTKSND
jgi:hypothetical protein